MQNKTPNSQKIKAAILGVAQKSKSMKAMLETLDFFGVSALTSPIPRTSAALAAWIQNSESDGARVFIVAIAPNVDAEIAAKAATLTKRPVLAYYDKPSNVTPEHLLRALPNRSASPYALLAAGLAGAKNSALCAIHILALEDPILASKIKQFRSHQTMSALASRLPQTR